MGFSETKQQQVVEVGFDSESNSKKWVIAGIPLRSPLKPIFTNPEPDDIDGGDEECSTPTGEEARIPTRLTCPPPAPRKKKASLKCNYGVDREFFTPPDLETVFIRHTEKAS
ncbi:cyclin-dependent protein kinase inhibitor SMR6 [Ziziphus jujuba]|uniref:Cyclin-dependent protein kinase inhibitor SMR6 n=2 Tax=Ziziphus jujuba TaxID=326968 RepID=A0A6P4ADC7_ZIZJJ|nr:cyclin-dependent protein kinase inhibitor SMR6 [Ziziphus jujuba]KAH7515674.1 hypothetical protein FEM48_Zijuj10G0051700 [Ziziphus jujuba var. spinosa]